MMTDTAGTRTRDRSDDEPWVVAGVDTHKDTHHVAVLNAATGAGLGDMRVPATPAGYDRLHDFVRSHGRIRMIGIEGTGSYGAGLARALRAAGAPIREVIRPKRSQRRRGKSDPIDAYAAAGRALAEADALPVAKTGTGPCEQIRVLLARRRSAMKARARRPPADHRPAGHRPRRRAHPPRTVSAARGLIGALARTRPAPTADTPASTTMRTLRRPGPPPPDPGPTRSPTSTPSCAHQPPAPPRRCSPPRRCAVNHRHPARRRRRQPRPNPHRGILRRPVRRRPDPPPAPGKTNRHRLNRGGDRQANREPHPNAPPGRRPAHQGLRRPPHRHGQELQRDTAPPPNAPSPAKHGTC